MEYFLAGVRGRGDNAAVLEEVLEWEYAAELSIWRQNPEPPFPRELQEEQGTVCLGICRRQILACF